MTRSPQTLFAKVWQQHEVCAESSATPAVLYIDLHLVHEVTSPQAFALLLSSGVGYLLTTQLTHEQLVAWGWRLPFLFSVVLVLIALWIR